MALKYSDELPGQIDTPGATYPQGQARNVSAPGAGDGTPWYANLVNDLLFGPWQWILKFTGTVPSGNPDTANTSQYMEALGRWIWGTLISGNWTQEVVGAVTLNAACYSPSLGYFVAVGEAGKVYATDGFQGSLTTIGGAPNLNAVCWSEDLGMFIAVGDGGVIYTSANAAAWSLEVSGTTTDLYSIAVKPGSPDTLFAVGDASFIDSEPNGVYSTNGSVWTPSDVPFGAGVKSVCWAAGLNVFVCMPSGGAVATSPTGAAWTTLPDESDQSFARALVWSDFYARVIAVGNGGKVSSSADLVTWDEVTDVLGGTTLYAVAVDENLGQVVAVGANGIAAAIDPTTTWYTRIERASVNHLGAAFGPALGFFVVTGEDGQWMQSLRGLHP